MSKFSQSVKQLQEKEFKKYQEKYGQEPDENLSQRFNQIIDKVTEKRSKDYLDSIQRRYPKELIDKVFAWAQREMSPLEMDGLRKFEDLCFTYFEANQDSLSARDIKVFFDAKGKPKKYVDDPFDSEIGEVYLDEDGNVIETFLAPKVVKPQEITREQAMKMTSEELGKILPHSD